MWCWGDACHHAGDPKWALILLIKVYQHGMKNGDITEGNTQKEQYRTTVQTVREVEPGSKWDLWWC